MFDCIGGALQCVVERFGITLRLFGLLVSFAPLLNIPRKPFGGLFGDTLVSKSPSRIFDRGRCRRLGFARLLAGVNFGALALGRLACCAKQFVDLVFGQAMIAKRLLQLLASFGKVIGRDCVRLGDLLAKFAKMFRDATPLGVAHRRFVYQVFQLAPCFAKLAALDRLAELAR